VVEPSVSTAFRFLTRTFFLASFMAVKAREAVMAPGKPSGTFETTIPIAKTKFVIAGYPTAKPSPKNKTPRNKAKTAIREMKIEISFSRGLYWPPAV
jgi:hypothetical protein